MGSLLTGLPLLPAPPPPPQLWSLQLTLDQRGAREPLLTFDWGVPATSREEVWEQVAERKGVGRRLRWACEAAEMWPFARKDPWKPVLAAKVATVLALITLLVFLREPRDIASHPVWAILTVVVVFEFSIGVLLLPLVFPLDG